MTSLTLTKSPVNSVLTLTKRCTMRCTSQCDGCHTRDNCVTPQWRLGDLLLCGPCKGVVEAYERVGCPIPPFPLTH